MLIENFDYKHEIQYKPNSKKEKNGGRITRKKERKEEKEKKKDIIKKKCTEKRFPIFIRSIDKFSDSSLPVSLQTFISTVHIPSFYILKNSKNTILSILMAAEHPERVSKSHNIF